MEQNKLMMELNKKVSGRVNSFDDFVNEEYVQTGETGEVSRTVTDFIKRIRTELGLSIAYANAKKIVADVTDAFKNLGAMRSVSYDDLQELTAGFTKHIQEDAADESGSTNLIVGFIKRIRTELGLGIRFEDAKKIVSDITGQFKSLAALASVSHQELQNLTKGFTRPVAESAVNEDGYGDKPFYFAKDGDTSKYFFRILLDQAKERCFVLVIGKFSKFAQPSAAKQGYAVISLIELTETELDQAIMDKGVFKPNENTIELKGSDLTRIFEELSICVADYLQKNPKVVIFYDEIQGLAKFPEYQEKLESSLKSWPGDAWKLQAVEKDKLNTISK